MVFAVETYCPATDGISAARIEEEVVLYTAGRQDQLRSTPQRNSRLPTPIKDVKLGWIGTGGWATRWPRAWRKAAATSRCGTARAPKAEPLAKYGAKVVDRLAELASRDIVFCMVSTWEDVKEVMQKLLSGPKKPKMVIECSSISLEGSAELREMLQEKGVQYLAAPVSGNAKVIKAGKLTFVVSGPQPAYEAAAAVSRHDGRGPRATSADGRAFRKRGRLPRTPAFWARIVISQKATG